MPEHPKATIPPPILERIRSICLPLPEAVESEAFGAPTFQIRTKNLAMLHGYQAPPSAWCKAGPGAQEAYVGSEPERYFRPPYLGGNGWIGIWLNPEVDPDWDEIEEIVKESYRLIAPKRLAAQVE